jgi:hypothetical protein
MITFEIPSGRASEARDAFAKLAKKATTLGVETPTMTISDEFAVEKSVRDEFTGKKKTIVVLKRTVEISETPVVLPGGWTLDGTITPTPEGNLVTTAPRRVIPESFRAADGTVCDHCHTNRRRKVTHVVSNEAGEQKRVGANCIRDFLGGFDPAQIARLLTYVRDLEALGDDDHFGGFTARDTRTPLDGLLSLTALMIRRRGWRSKGEAYKLNMERGNDSVSFESTAEHVGRYRFDSSKYGNEFRAEIGPIEDEDRETAAAAIAWAKGDFAADGVSPENDYLANLRVIVRLGYSEPKFDGLAISLIAAWKKATEKAIERETLAAASDFVGVEGERSVFTLTVIRSFIRETQFGVTDMIEMIDAAGNVVAWWASGDQGLNVGDVVTGKATVKRHALNRGVKTTTVNRFKWVRVEEAIA